MNSEKTSKLALQSEMHEEDNDTHCLIFQSQELQVDIQDHVTSVDYINRTGADLHKKAPEEKAKKLMEDLEDMNSRWTKVSSEIDDRVEKFEGAKEKLKQHQVCCFRTRDHLLCEDRVMFELLQWTQDS